MLLVKLRQSQLKNITNMHKVIYTGVSFFLGFAADKALRTERGQKVANFVKEKATDLYQKTLDRIDSLVSKEEKQPDPTVVED